MDAITAQQAQQYIDAVSVSTEQVADTIEDEQSYEIVSVTKVKTAAKHKEETINKVSRSIAILPLSGNTYRDMVIESAKSMGTDAEVADSFTVSDTFYEHTDLYPLCKAKRNDTMYLYGIYERSSKPVYVHNGVELSKEQVAEFLTPAEAKKLLGDTVTVTENKANSLTHKVNARTVKLDNVKSIKKI